VNEAASNVPTLFTNTTPWVSVRQIDGVPAIGTFTPPEVLSNAVCTYGSSNSSANSTCLGQGEMIPACTGSITFVAGAALNTCVLTGSVTASTLAAPAIGAGNVATIMVCQTTGNSYTFTFPSNFRGVTSPITPTAGKCSTYTSQYSANQTDYMLTGGVTNQ
jgi:hypothetical protein